MFSYFVERLLQDSFFTLFQLLNLFTITNKTIQINIKLVKIDQI